MTSVRDPLVLLHVPRCATLPTAFLDFLHACESKNAVGSVAGSCLDLTDGEHLRRKPRNGPTTEPGRPQITGPTTELRGKLIAGWTFQQQLYELKAARGAPPRVFS